jgi:hypothetical protein
MASAIDDTQPPAGNASTAAMRANMTAAKSEIEALQQGVVSNIVRAATTPVECPTGVMTPQGLAPVALLDTGNLADTVNGTITIPADCTHGTFGISFPPVWPSTAGTYRKVSVEALYPGDIWVEMASVQSPPTFLDTPPPGPVSVLYPIAALAGSKLRFSAKQDSGSPLTPGSLAIYAQFMVFP